MTTSLAQYRHLSWTFAQRELKSRYRSSMLGWLWSLLNPLVTLTIYSVVFVLIFRTTAPELGNGHRPVYALYLFTGLILWNLFNNVLNGSMTALRGAGPLLQKVYFPAITPIAGAAVSVVVQSLIEGAVLLGALLLLGNISWTWLLAPVVLALLFVSASGFSLFFALWNVRFGDVQYLVGVALQALFYLTPILYQPSFVPEEAFGLPVRDLLYLNPLTSFIQAMRGCVYELTPPTSGQWAVMVGTALVCTIGGVAYFQRGSLDVSEEL
jgi:ABC-type polysaccharide/polyol phosphate export permease